MSSYCNCSSDEDIETSSKNDNVESYHKKDTFKDANNEWRIFCATIENADPVLVKLNELLRNGEIKKDRIFFKYLKDTIEFFINPKHGFDPEVVEFFSTIEYLGERKTLNFIRGPMFYKQGKSFRSKEDLANVKMNLRGPSLRTFQKSNTDFTTKSGIIKYLSMINLKLMVNETMNSVVPLIDTSDLKIVPCAHSTDGTALKPAVEYDPLSKANIGLSFPVSVDYVKKNTPPDTKQLEQDIIHEAVGGCVTFRDNVTIVPLSVEYCTKSGKTRESVYIK